MQACLQCLTIISYAYIPISSFLCPYLCETYSNYITTYIATYIPYSGYNLQGAIFANHQISHLAVIFAIVKVANHYMYRDYKRQLIPVQYYWCYVI